MFPLGGNASVANAISDSGQIVGRSARGGGFHAFLWQKGRMLDLGSGEAWAINNHGQVVAFSGDYAILWQNGKVTKLDIGFGGSVDFPDFSINERGEVIGGSNHAFHATVWEKGKTYDLGTLPNHEESYTTALNNHGQIIGTSVDKAGEAHAVLWTVRSGD